MKTTSEEMFEKFLTENNLPFEKIKEEDSPRPDYLVQVGELKLVFEVKELAEDENFGVLKNFLRPDIKVHSRTLGDHVRSKISDAKKQIQYAAKQGLPSILVLYNNIDPLHMFGTEDMDFISAMYGETTVILNKKTKAVSESFQGKNQSLSAIKNTSFSSVARLRPYSGKMTLTLFENVFSKVKIPYEQLPPCFEVKRVEISDEPIQL
jgi:hypothetical protein